MEEDTNPKSRNRLKTAGFIVACGLAGIVAVALGFMLADALIIYAMEGSAVAVLYIWKAGGEYGRPPDQQDLVASALDAVIRASGTRQRGNGARQTSVSSAGRTSRTGRAGRSTIPMDSINSLSMREHTTWS